MPDVVLRHDRGNPRRYWLATLPERDGRGRFHRYPAVLSSAERHSLDYMLSTLGFQRFQMAYVGLRQTINSFAAYQLFRHMGLNHAQAVDQLLYPEAHNEGNGHASEHHED